MAFERQVTAKERQLIRDFGAMLLSGRPLQMALGYRTLESLRQAIKRGTVPVRVFPIENRRGKFALPKDVARWLVHLEIGQVPPTTRNDRDQAGFSVTKEPQKPRRERRRRAP